MNPDVSNSIEYDELAEGYEYPVSIITLDMGDVAAYLKAVNGADFININIRRLPPLAVAARALAELSRGTISPPGTVHSSQELDFKEVSYVGERLKLIARVGKKLDRGDLHLLTTNFSIFNPSLEIVMIGKITVACRGPEARWLRTRAHNPS